MANRGGNRGRFGLSEIWGAVPSNTCDRKVPFAQQILVIAANGGEVILVQNLVPGGAEPGESPL